MTTSHWARLAACALILTLIGLVQPVTASATGRGKVDESRLVPSLSTSFAPWVCKVTRTGPVCSAERHARPDWEALDIPCRETVWNLFVENSYQTRYYDKDYLNYSRTFRVNNTDYFRPSTSGPATATITSRRTDYVTFGVRGNDQTLTTTGIGEIWNIRTTSGRQIFRVVGTLVEPNNGPATFTGTVVKNGVRTWYHNDPLSDFFTDAEFFEMMCDATTLP